MDWCTPEQKFGWWVMNGYPLDCYDYWSTCSAYNDMLDIACGAKWWWRWYPQNDEVFYNLPLNCMNSSLSKSVHSCVSKSLACVLLLISCTMCSYTQRNIDKQRQTQKTTVFNAVFPYVSWHCSVLKTEFIFSSSVVLFSFPLELCFSSSTNLCAQLPGATSTVSMQTFCNAVWAQFDTFFSF